MTRDLHTRLEIRCSYEIRELASAICEVEGDTTFSTMIRRLVIDHARTVVRHGGPERIARILDRLSSGAA